jgi:hypothetical protein
MPEGADGINFYGGGSGGNGGAAAGPISYVKAANCRPVGLSAGLGLDLCNTQSHSVALLYHFVGSYCSNVQCSIHLP